jgi:succinyl-CoA synthetase alpha subunit
MGILLSEKTRVVVQGMTGKEGAKAAKAMLDYYTQVACGVTPKKGGQEVEGKPIYNSLAEAKEKFLEINTSAIYVPPFAVKDAVLEAIKCDIKLINIMAERVPIKDTAYFLAAAKEKNITVVGPSSLGLLVPEVGRIGVVGGPLVKEIFQPGSVGIISRSGGMTNELSWQIRRAGLGDLLMGTTYADLLKLFQEDETTKAVVIFGEHGGSYEFEIVKLIESGGFTKPLAVYVGGKFASLFPVGMNIGHAGAIVGRGQGAADKERALKSVGVMIADRYEDLVELIKPLV